MMERNKSLYGVVKEGEIKHVICERHLREVHSTSGYHVANLVDATGHETDCEVCVVDELHKEEWGF